ncbi:MAG: MaoC family dehydratase N-terminal domain-containing protein [Actinobacteria bacterium]|nr:MaoC family dehydratase N-terminal domain-containing protein [Actinomycetota bacterium]MBU1944974.1 MaoC family dehydratase N-terminal domain-containing protein [Actinomycetota bacterium]MBU2688455.1 MaoC family dehydratase N-terminal domain-containing protein [Actinomycetota bacterium]
MPEEKLFFEDASEGDEAPELSLEVTRTHIVKYAGAGGDFNPIHTDEAFAKAVGLPSVFAMGLMQGGYLARMLTDWLGVGNLKRYKIRFTGQVWPGETITCRGRITRRRSADGENLVDCELAVVNQDGQSKIVGEATAVLPSRG